MTAANCNMRNPGVVFVAKQTGVFYPLLTRCHLIVPFCLVFRPSVTIQTLFPVSSCHCEEEFVPSRVACFSLTELTLTCGCERPRSPWGGLGCEVTSALRVTDGRTGPL